MRRHPVYVSFERRWQLPVYFQLRWKEIIGTLEDTLSLTRLESITPKGMGFGSPVFINELTVARWLLCNAPGGIDLDRYFCVLEL